MKLKNYFPHIFIFSVLVVLILGYGYFFAVSSSLAEKPDLEKPEIKNELESQHFTYLINQLGGYKLHEHTFTGETPKIEFSLGNDERYFYKTSGGQFLERKWLDSDIVITIDRKDLLNILKSSSEVDAFQRTIDEGGIKLSARKSQAELAFKGYRSFYENIEQDNAVTANVVNMSAAGITSGIEMGILFMTAIIIGMIIKIES